jgi:hypothetical protein
MECTHSKQNMVLGTSDERSRSHLYVCSECSRIQTGIDHSMQVLEERIEVPETLLSSILSRKEISFAGNERQKDFSLFFQFSTVIAAAIMLGIVLGFHANTQILTSRNKKKTEALIELKEMHHLNVNRQPLF